MSHLAVSVIHSQWHVGRRQQQQGLLFWQLLFQPVNDLRTLVGSLKEQKRNIMDDGGKKGNQAVPEYHATSLHIQKQHLKQNDDFYKLIPGTFSLWISLLREEILILTASSSSSGTCGIGTGSVSSAAWKVRSDSGMYHLQSYCWLFLRTKRHTEQEWEREEEWRMKRNNLI